MLDIGQRLDKSWDTHIVNQHPCLNLIIKITLGSDNRYVRNGKSGAKRESKVATSVPLDSSSRDRLCSVTSCVTSKMERQKGPCLNDFYNGKGERVTQMQT